MKNILVALEPGSLMDIEKISKALSKIKYDSIFLLYLIFTNTLTRISSEKKVEIMKTAKEKLAEIANILKIPEQHTMVEIEHLASFATLRSYIKDKNISTLLTPDHKGNPFCSTMFNLVIGSQCEIELIN